jgi:hypothetical protein
MTNIKISDERLRQLAKQIAKGIATDTVYANHFIYDVFRLGSTATHAIDVELRDRQCNRQDFTIPITDKGISAQGCAFSSLVAEIDAASIWRLNAWGEPYECQFD